MELNMKCKKCGAMLELVPSYLNGFAYVCPNKCAQVKITYSDRTEPYKENIDETNRCRYTDGVLSESKEQNYIL